VKIAVIGAGIAGLGAAWHLHPEHEVWVFEKEARIGGHTHTVRVETREGPVSVDTGFIVHNRENYPNLVVLLERLGVATGPSDMSFAYQGPEFRWCSRGLNGLLTQRRNLFRPRYWAFWKEVLRFNSLGRAMLELNSTGTTLRAFLDAYRFSADFREAYLLPMGGAVWSTTPQEMLDFPALTLLSFFHNHGMLGITTQRPWRTIPGGTSRYLEPLSRPFRDRIRTGVEVRVCRMPEGVDVRVRGEEPARFDQVVFACHGDQVLPILEDATPLEREVLGAFASNGHAVWLHEDAGLLPAERRAWASWNFRQQHEAPDRLLLTYHMNRLQDLPTRRDLFVSLDPEGVVGESRVHRRLHYEHPRFTLEALGAQQRWSDISGRDRLHFCGAHWRYGFHEDGLWSGMRVARALGAQC
jgi:predicted NAD/FAD-binding protein